jgi:hypothetical protein
MCNVIAIRHIEDCFNGDFIKELELDSPLDTAVMSRMAEGATLQYHPDFPRPYFRVDRLDAYTIQGVIGKTSFRVTFSQSATKETVDALISRIQKGEQDGCETSSLLPACQGRRRPAGPDAFGDEDANGV